MSPLAPRPRHGCPPISLRRRRTGRRLRPSARALQVPPRGQPVEDDRHGPQPPGATRPRRGNAQSAAARRAPSTRRRRLQRRATPERSPTARARWVRGRRGTGSGSSQAAESKRPAGRRPQVGSQRALNERGHRCIPQSALGEEAGQAGADHPVENGRLGTMPLVGATLVALGGRRLGVRTSGTLPCHRTTRRRVSPSR
jgi:hypothetical protein